MNSMNHDDEMILKSTGGVESLAKRLLEHLYRLFSKLWTPIQVALAAGGLGVALYYGYALRLTLLNTHRNVTATLATKLEPTRTTDQGISAFLLSGVKDDWTKPEHLDVAKIDSVLTNVADKIQEVTENAQTAKRQDSHQLQSRPTSLNVRDIIDKLKLSVIHSETTPPWQNWQTAIGSLRTEGFMVVPAMSLRRKGLDEPPLARSDTDNERELTAVFKHNPEILFDLNLAFELEPIMRKIDSASGDMLSVVQTYFITESGVFIIRANRVANQLEYYRSQFQPYTQFMDRPYFWGAIDRRIGRFSPFDYGTKPYLDLGGNGFVVTFSKKFDLPNGRVGVLCVDAKLPDEVTDEAEKHLENMGARVSDFYWSEDRGIEAGKDGPLPRQFSWFDRQLHESREAKSLVLGNIATEPNTSSSRSQDEADKVVRFTVPVVSTEYGSGKRRTRLLAVEFDSGSIRKNLTKDLALFTAGIVLVIALTWRLLWDYIVLKREMSNVLEKISKVMRDAATPFVWLDEKNEFVKINRSMLKLLEHDNLEDLRKQSPTFMGLVTDATQETYTEVLEASGAGHETGEYKISVITKTGKILCVRAHGERIPYPTSWRRGLPHRFGIFVEVIESEHATS